MDLWIRSQDKRDLMKAEHIIVVGSSIEVASLDTRLNFAQYDSEKRALEVLDEIQEMDFANNPNVKLTSYGYVYEMPKE